MKSPTVARMMFGCFLLLSCLPLLAQTSVPVPVRPAHPVQRVREEPCWEQAGVSRTAMEQRRNIERSTRAEVESVCADSALSAQQKHENIRRSANVPARRWRLSFPLSSGKQFAPAGITRRWTPSRRRPARRRRRPLRRDAYVLTGPVYI